MNTHLIETEVLVESAKQDKNTYKIIDATWHMPNLNKNAEQEYLAAHIPNAIFFDIDKIADINSNLPHMLPHESFFNEQMDEMGISIDDHLIIYDSYGFLSSARVWWTFKIMGHKKVSILNGGLKKWLQENREIHIGHTRPTATSGYNAHINKDMVKSIAQIHRHIDENDIQIIDARSNGRFKGADPEPRAGLSSGHMPNGFNLPFNLLANDDGTVKNKDEITKLFNDCELNLNKPIITTCGSGITAANLFFALDYIGSKDIALFDGSWTEYATNINSIIIKDVK